MTTENQVSTETTEPVVTETTTETSQESTPAPSPIELKAREQGWVSKEEWIKNGKHPDEWRSAREYAERGELFEEIHRLKEDGKQTSKAFRALVEHHKKVRETAMKDAIAALKAEKKEALLNNDVEAVLQIDERIEAVRTQPADLPELEIPAEPTGPSPTFKAWHKQNDWYQLQGDDEASRIADVIGATFKKNHPEATEKEFLAHVESKIAKRFPELFENPKAKAPPEVGGRSEIKGDGSDTFKLTPDEEKACASFVAMKVMTRKEYIEEIKKTRGA